MKRMSRMRKTTFRLFFSLPVEVRIPAPVAVHFSAVCFPSPRLVVWYTPSHVSSPATVLPAAPPSSPVVASSVTVTVARKVMMALTAMVAEA